VNNDPGKSDQLKTSDIKQHDQLIRKLSQQGNGEGTYDQVFEAGDWRRLPWSCKGEEVELAVVVLPQLDPLRDPREAW
jgi:hypothetical protein